MLETCHGFESRVKRASQFKKSLTAVTTIECHFTLSVVCLIVECTKDSVRVTSKQNIQIVVGRLGWKWIERSVLELLLLKQKEVELLLTITCCKSNPKVADDCEIRTKLHVPASSLAAFNMSVRGPLVNSLRRPAIFIRAKEQVLQ